MKKYKWKNLAALTCGLLGYGPPRENACNGTVPCGVVEALAIQVKVSAGPSAAGLPAGATRGVAVAHYFKSSPKFSALSTPLIERVGSFCPA